MLLTLFLFSILYQHTLSVVYCGTVSPPSYTGAREIVCERTCSLCKIQCSSLNQCKQNKLYSAANTTILDCSYQGSCDSMHVYIGDTGDYPTGYTSTDFSGKEFTQSSLICRNDVRSCQSMAYQVQGSFINGVSMSGGAISALKASIIINTDQTLSVTCNNNCGSAYVYCNAGNCNCVDSCTTLRNNGIQSYLNCILFVSCVYIRILIKMFMQLDIQQKIQLKCQHIQKIQHKYPQIIQVMYQQLHQHRIQVKYPQNIQVSYLQ